MAAEIVLFDLDGVLIYPGGYRAAVRLTLEYFLRELHLDLDLLLQEEEIGLFESVGLTGEWDMIPLCLGAILDQAAREHPSATHLSNWAELVDGFRSGAITTSRPAYRALIAATSRHLVAGIPAADAVLAARADLFPYASGSPILAELFSGTRDVYQSRSTQLLQAYILGDRLYEQYWRQPSPVCSESTLLQFDEMALLPEYRDRLVELRSGNLLRYAAFTARPSAQSVNQGKLQFGCTPEAELGWDILGFPDKSIVGYGAMQRLVSQTGASTDQLLKPSPVHALAAIMTAAQQEEPQEWLAAYQLAASMSPSTLLPPLPASVQAGSLGLPKRLVLHVFEDSLNGIRSGRQAAHLLEKTGHQVDFHAWGIARQKEKTAALEKEGATVFSDVNLALKAVWPNWF